MATIEEVMEHEHPVYWCANCREAFTPAEIVTWLRSEDASARCPNCNAIMYAEPHLEECAQ